MKKKSKKKQSHKTHERREPRQPRLPGTEDEAIQELETAAEEYADKRDQRQALLADEVSLKGELLHLMKKHGKEHYSHQGIEITVTHEEESVKVKIRKPEPVAAD